MVEHSEKGGDPETILFNKKPYFEKCSYLNTMKLKIIVHKENSIYYFILFTFYFSFNLLYFYIFEI